jgi:hypothetical protein
MAWTPWLTSGALPATLDTADVTQGYVSVVDFTDIERFYTFSGRIPYSTFTTSLWSHAYYLFWVTWMDPLRAVWLLQIVCVTWAAAVKLIIITDLYHIWYPISSVDDTVRFSSGAAGLPAWSFIYTGIPSYSRTYIFQDVRFLPTSSHRPHIAFDNWQFSAFSCFILHH